MRENIRTIGGKTEILSIGTKEANKCASSILTLVIFSGPTTILFWSPPASLASETTVTLLTKFRLTMVMSTRVERLEDEGSSERGKRIQGGSVSGQLVWARNDKQAARFAVGDGRVGKSSDGWTRFEHRLKLLFAATLCLGGMRCNSIWEPGKGQDEIHQIVIRTLSGFCYLCQHLAY
jgi:hypothetical protein